MTAPLRWKLIGGFVVVFIAGGIAGAFLGAVLERHHRWESAHHQPLVQRVRDRMRSRLDLTPEQMKKSDPILEKAARRLEEIRTESGQRVREVFSETDRELAPQLTDAQRQKMRAFEAQHREAAEQKDEGG
jgi:hypothetical protein